MGRFVGANSASLVERACCTARQAGQAKSTDYGFSRSASHSGSAFYGAVPVACPDLGFDRVTALRPQSQTHRRCIIEPGAVLEMVNEPSLLVGWRMSESGEPWEPWSRRAREPEHRLSSLAWQWVQIMLFLAPAADDAGSQTSLTDSSISLLLAPAEHLAAQYLRGGARRSLEVVLTSLTPSTNSHNSVPRRHEWDILMGAQDSILAQCCILPTHRVLASRKCAKAYPTRCDGHTIPNPSTHQSALLHPPLQKGGGQPGSRRSLGAKGEPRDTANFTGDDTRHRPLPDSRCRRICYS
ncbi:hypothetical protein B0J14DRAFT_559255 [Halenospora varia]|nr:hypothetical protein B0J14DRAFT_559255 [Halenospora varia]